MKNTQKLSNSFLIYSAIIVLVLIYVYGIFSVIHFVNEMSDTGFFTALSEHFVSISLGIVCLIIITPTYRLAKSLRILEITDHENGTSIITVYSPFIVSDMRQADQKVILQHVKNVRQHSYFSRLVELHIEDSSSEKVIKSVMNQESVTRITKNR